MTSLTKQLSGIKDGMARAARLNVVARLAPDRVLHRTADLSPERYELLGVTEGRVLVPPTTVTLPTPALREFLARQIAVPSEDGRFETEPVSVWTVADARLDPATGAVVTENGTLLIDSIKNDGRLRRVAAYSRAMPAARPIPGPLSTVMGTHTSNHFHWLIETLPRLHSLAMVAEPMTLIMPTTLSALQRVTLAMCLPPGIEVRFVPPTEWVGTDRLILPSFLTRQWDFAYLPTEHLQATRRHILAAYDLAPDHIGQRRLYISRARAGVRHVRNEDEVVARLARGGFETVYLETLAFDEQVRLLHDAAVVVSPHGAGLANLLFAGRIPVIELATAVATPVYFFLALALGQAYHYVYPVEMGEGEAVDSMADGRRYSAVRDQDITVPIAELDRVLAEAGVA
jgi:capsular polysaccharide biosynthesis protein